MPQQTDNLGWTIPTPGEDSGGPDGTRSDGWPVILNELFDNDIEPDVAEALEGVATRVVDVGDHGAVGDGTTDDSGAIQSAIDSIPDGERRLLAFTGGKEYRLESTVTVPLETVRGIRGNNAYITLAADTAAFHFQGTDTDFTANPVNNPDKKDTELKPLITGLQIRSDLSLSGAPFGPGLLFESAFAPTVSHCHLFDLHHAIQFVGTNRNLQIFGNNIWNCSGAGVFYDATNIHQSYISNNHISYCERLIHILDTEYHNLIITGNSLETKTLDNHVNAINLIKIAHTSSGTNTVTHPMDHCIIANNSIEDHSVPSTDGATDDTLVISDSNPHENIGTRYIISNNTFSRTNYASINMANLQGVSITGNTFLRVFNGPCIRFAGDRMNSVSISNNVIGDTQQDVNGFVRATSGTIVSNLSITNNIARQLTGYIIDLTTGASLFGVHITDNNWMMGNANSGYLVDIDASTGSASQGIRVADNDIRTSGTTADGIRVTASQGPVMCKDNMIANFGGTTAFNFPATVDGEIVVKDNLSQ